jgi:hypothetical protein
VSYSRRAGTFKPLAPHPGDARKLKHDEIERTVRHHLVGGLWYDFISHQVSVFVGALFDALLWR